MCVVCNGTSRAAVEALQSSALTQAVLLPSTTCRYYAPATDVVAVSTGAALRAKERINATVGRITFNGTLSISAPSVDLVSLSADHVDVVARSVAATGVVAHTGTFALLNSNVNADLSNINGAVYDVAVSNCRGVVSVKCDTPPCRVVTQDALDGPAVTLVAGTGIHITNLSGLLSTFGNAYEIAFESDGVFEPPSPNLASAATIVTTAACLLAAMLPLCHATEARLLLEGFGRHPHAS